MNRRAGAVPITKPAVPTTQERLDAAIATVEQRKMQAEFDELVRLAEQVFPREWNVRVEPYSDGVNVQVRYYIARGRNPIEALRAAIDWYRAQGGSRIILPPK